MRYTLPTQRQILFTWDVKPAAKIVALILQDWADKRMGHMSDKEYNHMPESEQKEHDAEQRQDAKITVSIRKLAEIANASQGGINSALDELQGKGFVESDRPMKGKDGNDRKAYRYRLHQGKPAFFKTYL